MRLFFFLFCLVTVSLSDDIFLKTGFTISGVEIIEINNLQIEYIGKDGAEKRILLRDIESILQSSERSSDSMDRVYLRDGSVVEGRIENIEYYSVTIIDKDGKTLLYEPEYVLRVKGNRSALSFRTSDNKYLFLSGAHIRFIGDRPSKSLVESEYRFIVSMLTSFPLPSFRFSYPGLLEGKARTGYGISFTLDYGLSEGNALSFSYRFSENKIQSPDSLGGSFSEWTNHFMTAGVKKYFSLDRTFRWYAEGKIGYVFSSSPEHDRLTSGQTGGVSWNIGGGFYLTDNLSLDLHYVSASPNYKITLSYLDQRANKSIIKEQYISLFLLGLGYTFGSYN